MNYSLILMALVGIGALLVMSRHSSHHLPPHQPNKNAFVERFHRTQDEECLQVHRPATLEDVGRVTQAFRWHYNHQRPNQALSCGNRPPYVAFPSLPKLPPLPDQVDPDRWLQTVHRKCFKRRVSANGSIQVDKHDDLSAPDYADACWSFRWTLSARN